MARLSLTTRRRRQRRMTIAFWHIMMSAAVFFMFSLWRLIVELHRTRQRIQYNSSRIKRYSILHQYIYQSDSVSTSNIRMTRTCFKNLCGMLEAFGGLKPSTNIDIEEQVAIFLQIVAHNVKHRVMARRFNRSGEQITTLFARVCNSVIRLHHKLVKKPESVPDNSTDQRWKWFKNCLGALDSTYIKCLAPREDRFRYKTRKNDIATNVLGVCSQDMQFIYILVGWEGSALDNRVLQNALCRTTGLKHPKPGYYLVDSAYKNEEGFLAPYRGEKYHLNDWCDGQQPATPKELFNMKHSSARNVIGKCFGILKARWRILEDNKCYDVVLKNRIIMACCLLHNYVRQEMISDPFENECELDEGTGDLGYGFVTSNEWGKFRDDLAQSMFDSWTADN